ncbi:MAG TPA: hypothetical protein VM260_17690 [Pirellula sp.]|nr:hypothetical protein [Pirellula sp.]
MQDVDLWQKLKDKSKYGKQWHTGMHVLLSDYEIHIEQLSQLKLVNTNPGQEGIRHKYGGVKARAQVRMLIEQAEYGQAIARAESLIMAGSMNEPFDLLLYSQSLAMTGKLERAYRAFQTARARIGSATDFEPVFAQTIQNVQELLSNYHFDHPANTIELSNIKAESEEKGGTGTWLRVESKRTQVH